MTRGEVRPPGVRDGRALPQPLTIRDVAALAGVSPGTVSKVMNGAPGVGQETRDRVLRLVQDLDYHPNASAQSLVARRAGSIGVVIPHTGRYSMSSAYWPILLTSITEAAAERGLNVLLSTARSEEDVDSAYQAILRGRRVDGLVVGAEQFGEKQLMELVLRRVPFVTVGKSPFLSHWHVDIDNEGGTRAMTLHLAGLGHRRILLLAGPESYPSVRERVQAFQQTAAEKGVEASVRHCSYQAEEAVRDVRQALAAQPRPHAVFAAAGDLATAALVVVRELGLRIPEDLALASFDDHPFYELFSPPLTAVSQPIYETGRAALDMLFALMDGNPPESRQRIMPTRLVVRRSCGFAG